MSALDVILAILLLFAFYKGYKQGLFSAIASLVGLIAGVIGAVYFSEYAARYLAERVSWSEQTINLAAFAITFLVIIYVASLLGKAMTKVADVAALGTVNKLLGGVFTAIKYAFVISVIFMYINASSSLSGFIISEEKKETSLLYPPVAALAPIIMPRILQEVDAIKEQLNEIVPKDEEQTTPTN